MARGDLLLSAVHPRRVLAASAGAWTAAEILHLAHTPGVEVGGASAAVTALVYAVMTRRAARTAGRLSPEEHARRHRWAAQGAVWTGAGAAWVTAAAVEGPYAGPHCAMTMLWAGGTLGALTWMHRHEAVRAAKRWKAARAEWLATAHTYGLHGSHLVEHEDTRLGERQLLDVTGTGKLASQLASGHLAERIAQQKGLPVSRVKIRPGHIAGKLEISVRYKDPWKHPIPHPVLDKDPELDLPVPCTIRDPLPVGQNPETGEALEIVLWDYLGAKNILIVAKKRAGKTVLLSCLRERVTAAADAVLWDINLSKAAEDREWAPACQHAACGPAGRRKALSMLKAAYKIITDRGSVLRDTTVFEPTPADPLIVLVVDEIDELTVGNDFIAQQARFLLGKIASKNGSEGVVLVQAGQRGTASWVGGGDVRANVDYVCMGKVGRRGEMMHAAGDMGLELPDMSKYGEGKPGVWTIAEVGGDYQVGRTFNLRELTDIRRLAAERDVTRRPAPQPALSHAGGSGGDHQEEPPPEPEAPSGIAHLDESLEAALPDDLRDRLRRMGEKNDQTRQNLDEAARLADSLPAVDPAKLAESAEERWRQAAEASPVPDDARGALLELLAGEGTTISRAADTLSQTKWTVRCWLEALRLDGVAAVAGKGRGARWRLADPSPGGDGT